MKTLKELKELYCSVFYIEETMILDVIAAITIATKLPGDPIWLLIIGGSSSGKSELVNTVSKVPFVFPVSSMTENTFLSNMRISDGKEASLLHEIGTSGMIVMKDYTSILAMRQEKSDIIISQMREIYDGALTKRAGNGKSESWAGKINWIGAVTDAIYTSEDETAGMGRRTINYVMPIQDRRRTLERAKVNNADIADKRLAIQEAFAEYVMHHLENLPENLPDLPEDFSEELMDLADFVTLVRTPCKRDFKGELLLVPSPEMGMRAFQSMQTLAKVLVHLHTSENPHIEKGDTMNHIREIIRRIAFDSIPKQTTLVLGLLAKYEAVTTKGTAQELRYPTELMRKWLENVNVLGICERMASDGVGPDRWVINKEYRNIMIQYGGVKPEKKTLADKNESIINDDIQPTWITKKNKPVVGSDDPGVLNEQVKRANEIFESF